MKIHGIENKTEAELHMELQSGGRFVIYTYAISVLVMTFKRPSDIYYIAPGESGVSKGVSFTIISVLLGWWGIPWGPIYTIRSIVNNFSGGKDVTRETVAWLSSHAA